jgi:hypothetical protein
MRRDAARNTGVQLQHRAMRTAREARAPKWLYRRRGGAPETAVVRSDVAKKGKARWSAQRAPAAAVLRGRGRNASAAAIRARQAQKGCNDSSATGHTSSRRRVQQAGVLSAAAVHTRRAQSRRVSPMPRIAPLQRPS